MTEDRGKEGQRSGGYRKVESEENPTLYASLSLRETESGSNSMKMRQF